jgi:hypothetical protein
MQKPTLEWRQTCLAAQLPGISDGGSRLELRTRSTCWGRTEGQAVLNDVGASFRPSPVHSDALLLVRYWRIHGSYRCRLASRIGMVLARYMSELSRLLDRAC